MRRQRVQSANPTSALKRQLTTRPEVNQASAIENREHSLSEVEARFFHGKMPIQEGESAKKKVVETEKGQAMALHNGHHLLKTLLKYSCGEQLKEVQKQ